MFSMLPVSLWRSATTSNAVALLDLQASVNDFTSQKEGQKSGL